MLGRQLASLGLAVSLVAAAWAQEFRVETDIRLPDRKEKDPVLQQNLTLFTAQVVYDFLLTEPVEVVMFDPTRGRLVLLDPERKAQTVLTTAQVLDFTARIKAEASTASSGSGGQPFFFSPQFDEAFDEPTGWLTLSSKPLVYRAKGMRPKEPSVVRRYHEFCDWNARLNAMRKGTGNPPPFPRMELNRALAAHGLVPEEVERTITSQDGKGRVQRIHSQHLFNWQLSGTDRERIDQVGLQLTTFSHVDFLKYCEQLATATAAKSSARKQ